MPCAFKLVALLFGHRTVVNAMLIGMIVKVIGLSIVKPVMNHFGGFSMVGLVVAVVGILSIRQLLPGHQMVSVAKFSDGASLFADFD